ncbi:RNA polymerase sigma factor [Streptomyces sp. NPDC055794]
MTVRKNDPMDQPPATNEEFDALLAASSLKAPHVVAESSDIPAVARRRMAQALDRLQRTIDTSGSTAYPQPGEGSNHPDAPAEEEEPALIRRNQSYESDDDFARFVRGEHLSLVRFVATLGASWEEAEDAVNDVLTELLPRWHQIGAPRAYCRLAAERAWINSEVMLRRTPEEASRDLWTTPVHQISDPDAWLEGDNPLWALRLLNQEQRRVMAYFFDGYAPEEIAALLDKNPGTVRSNIRHARKRLNAALTAEQTREMSEATSQPRTQTHLGGS